MDAWLKAGKPVDSVTSIEPPEFADRVHKGEKVLDVRRITEAEEGHVKDATVIPLAELNPLWGTALIDRHLFDTKRAHWVFLMLRR